MLVAILVANAVVQDVHGSGNEAPTPFAYPRIGAARPYGVVVRHIDIEDELARQRVERPGFGCLLVPRLATDKYIKKLERGGRRTLDVYCRPISSART